MSMYTSIVLELLGWIFSTELIGVQETVLEPEVPTSIVLQSINSQSGAIEWVILIQIIAFLVFLTLLMNNRLRNRSTQRHIPPSNSSEHTTLR